MIEGLLVDVKSDELVAIFKRNGRLCLDGAEKADAKAGLLERASDDLKRAALEADMQNLMSRGDTREQVREIRGEAEEWRAKAEHFNFLAAHVVTDETYRLEASELWFDGGDLPRVRRRRYGA